MGNSLQKIILVLGVIMLCTPILAIDLPSAKAQEPEPFFSVVLGCPINNPLRMQWAEMVADSFREANIDARVEYGDFDFWIPRIFTPDENQIGLEFDEGGWDTFFIGWNQAPSGGQELWTAYHSDNMPTDGWGLAYALWENPTNDLLIDQINSELNEAARKALVAEWQHNFLEESPKATIFYPAQPLVFDPYLENIEESSHLIPAYGDPCLRFQGGDGHFTFSQPGEPFDYNPLIGSYYWDIVAVGPCYENLYYYTDNDALLTLQLTPALTEGPYEVSEDQRVWTIHLRDDVYWPTGFRFNSSDLLFTYQAILGLHGGFPPLEVDYSSFEIIDEFTLQVTLAEPYPWTQLSLNVPPVSYVAMKDIPFEEWRDHPSNRGGLWTTLANYDGTYRMDYNVYGPLGLGPYVCHESDTGWNSVDQTFKTRRRDLVTGFGDLLINPDPGYFNGPTGFRTVNMPDTYSAKTIYSTDDAIAALEAGEIDLTHPHYFDILTKLDLIDESWGTTSTESDLSLQEMGFNMRHSIFGTGEATPLGRVDPTRTDEAARYVRQALNYLIPRQRIIDEINDGFGQPGITHIHPLHTEFDPAIQPYEYDPVRAAELLAKAGYVLPRRGQLKVSGNFDYIIKEEIRLQVAALLTDFDTGVPISGAVVSATFYDPDGESMDTFTLTETIPEPGLYKYTSDLTLKDLKWPKGIYLVYVHAIILKEGWVQGEAFEIIQFHIDPPGESPPSDSVGLWLAALGVIGLASVVIHGFLVLFWLRRRKHQAP